MARKKVKPIISRADFIREGRNGWRIRRALWEELKYIDGIPTPRQLHKRGYNVAYMTALHWLHDLFGKDCLKKHKEACDDAETETA